MKTGWWRGTTLGAALAVLAVATAPASATAQVDDGECRCVDADGNAIDNCTCFVMPDLPEMPQVLAFGPNGDFGSFRSLRPRLGVSLSTDQDDALDARGAEVRDVMEEGPADRAGLRPGDVITAVDGRSLLEPLDDDVEEDFDLDASIPVQRLLALARDLEPDQTVEVAYLRDGEPLTATLEVEDLAGAWGAWARDLRVNVAPRIRAQTRELRDRLGPEMEALREQLREQAIEIERDGDRWSFVAPGEPFGFYQGGAAGGTAGGVRLTELTEGLAEYFGVAEGVLVTDVDEDSTLGLQAGDVVLRVGDREVTTPARVRRILATYDEGESVTLRVLRRGSEIDVMGRLTG